MNMENFVQGGILGLELGPWMWCKIRSFVLGMVMLSVYWTYVQVEI